MWFQAQLADLHRAPDSEEFLIGKALAALIPRLGIAYVIFGIFLVMRLRHHQPSCLVR